MFDIKLNCVWYAETREFFDLSFPVYGKIRMRKNIVYFPYTAKHGQRKPVF